MFWMKRINVILAAGLIFLPLIFVPAPISAGYDWLQFGGDAQHSQNNTSEGNFSPATVGGLHRLFQVPLPAVADGNPVYLDAVTTPIGVRNLLFLTTKEGHILALDANTGTLIWSHQFSAGSCRVNNGPIPCFTTSSPAIDPNREFVYSYGLDGSVHKFRVDNGVEIIGGGWPEMVTSKAFDEKGSSSLAVATDNSGLSWLYVANSGYPGDNGDYQGHLTTINLIDGSQHVFNALCSDQTVHFIEQPGSPDCPQVTAGIWSRAPVVYDAVTGRIYLTTGNGDFNPAAHDWGNSVIALNPDGTGANGAPLDSYTPTNYQDLTNTDTDLGSTAPALLPELPGSLYPHLAVQGGKDQSLRLINLDNLSGRGSGGNTGGEIGGLTPAPQGGAVLTQPAVWMDPADNSVWVFVTTGSGAAGLTVTVSASGIPALSPVWQNSTGGTSPLMVNGMLFVASNGQIAALDAHTGALLWSDTSIGGIHWESPIVAGGTLFITDEAGNLTAYAL